jgi:hypothetical protein
MVSNMNERQRLREGEEEKKEFEGGIGEMKKKNWM